MKLLQSISISTLCLIGGLVQAQNIIQPGVSAYSSQNPLNLDRTAARSRDGSGLTAGSSGISGAADSTHGRVANGSMWTTKGNFAAPFDTDPQITFDLGAVTNLETIRIWNYNENTFTKFGAKEIRVSTSLDNATFTALGDITLAQAGSTTAEPAQDFAAAVSSVRYVKLQILSNWDGAQFWSSITGNTNAAGADGHYLAGLSEVRFVGIPTPVATAVSNPGPVDAATGIEPESTLSWDTNNSDGAATGYRVVVGVGAVAYNYQVETATLPVSASTRMTWQPPANVIQKGSSFWWKVEKLTAAGPVSSPTWTFTTRAETTAEKDARMAWFRHDKFGSW